MRGMMKDCNCNSKNYTVTSIHEIDVDNLATPVDYILGIREVEDPSTGTNIMTPVRVPGKSIWPTGNNANVIAINANNDSLTIPEGQVRAGFISVSPGQNVMRYADANNKAQFLMLGNYTNGKMLIQSTGFFYIAGGHSYISSSQYYLGENGEPTTDETITGQKLFIPLDDHYLMVNLEA